MVFPVTQSGAVSSNFSNLFRANLARVKYVQALAAAYSRHLWIFDPDFATVNDEEAWTKMRRDAVIAFAIDNRRKGTAGLEWQFAPASEEPEDIRAAEVMTDLHKQIRQFTQARYLQSEYEFRGDAWLYIKGRRMGLKVSGDTELREWWAPTELEHVDRWRFRIVPDQESRTDPDAPRLKTHWEAFSVKDRVWRKLQFREHLVRSVFDDSEDTLGYGRGLMQAIFFYWRAKEIVFAQGLQGLERWAQGLVTAAIDSEREADEDGTNEIVRDAYVAELIRHRTEHILTHPKEDDIKVHDAPAGAHKIVEFWMEYLDRALERLILSSVLPTGGGAQSEGSFARAETEQDEKEKAFEAGRQALAEDFDCQLATLTWKLNRQRIKELLASEGLNPEARRPIFQLKSMAQRDPQQVAEVIATILNAGIPLVEKEVYEAINFSVPQGQATINPQQQQDGLASAFAGIPLNGDEGGGIEGDVSTEEQAESELLGKVGGITGAIDIIAKTKEGVLDRSSALAMLELFFQLTPEQAARLIPDDVEQPPPRLEQPLAA